MPLPNDQTLTPSPPTRRRRRALWFAGGALCGVILLLIAAAPTLLSTSRGAAALTAHINKRIPGQVTVSNLRLAWFSGQSADGLTIRDPQGQPALSADRITLDDATLWSLLTGTRDLGTVRLAKPTLIIQTHDDGSTNLHETSGLQPDKQKSKPTKHQPNDQPVGPYTNAWAASLHIDQGTATYQAPGHPPFATTIDGHLDLDPDGRISTAISATINHAGYRGGTAEANLRSSVTSQEAIPEIEGSIVFTDIPTALIDSLARTGLPIQQLLGPAVNTTLNINTQNGVIYANLTADAQHLTAHAALQTYEDQLRLADNTTVKLTLTTEAARSLLAIHTTNAPLHTEHPIEIQLGTESLTWRNTTEPFNLSNLSGRLILKTNDIALLSSDGKRLSINKLTTQTTADDANASLHIAANAELQFDDTTPTTQAARLTAGTTITQPPAHRHDLSTTNLAYRFELSIDDLPTTPIDRWTQAGGELVNWLGASANITADGTYTPAGTTDAHLSIRTPNAAATVPVRWSAGQPLLRDAVTAEFMVTPEASSRWLRRLHPLLNEAASSSQPIMATIHPTGTPIPTTPEAWRDLTVHADLNLGTIRFKDLGLINQIRTAFRRDHSTAPQALFTPAKVTYADGHLRYSNMTMTMDNLTLGFGGSIDQIAGRIDMTMSIAGATMAKAFDLHDVIGPDYRFEVPIKGDLTSPQLDLGAVTREAARLAAHSQIKHKLPGAEGETAGLILDLLLGGQQQSPVNPGQPDKGATDNDTPLTTPAPPSPDPAAQLIKQLLQSQLKDLLQDDETDTDTQQQANEPSPTKKDKDVREKSGKKKNKPSNQSDDNAS